MLAYQFTQTFSPFQKVQYQLALKVEAEPPMPCHGLLFYKPARLVQSGAVYLSNCQSSLQSGSFHSIDIRGGSRLLTRPSRCPCCLLLVVS
jgi:hypothetical protein